MKTFQGLKVPELKETEAKVRLTHSNHCYNAKETDCDKLKCYECLFQKDQTKFNNWLKTQ